MTNPENSDSSGILGLLPPEERERLERFFKELDGESSRAAAILAAAQFEDSLADAINAKFVNMDNKTRGRIFDGYGPLSTFSAKIDVGYALGWYGPKTRNGLHAVRKVRNKFAHASEPLEFSDEDIAKDCRKLRPHRLADPEDMRERYIRYLQETNAAIHTLGLGIETEPLP